MILAPLALALALGGTAAPAAATVPTMAPMSAPEALAYLGQNRARLVVDRRFETRLTRWALKGLGAAVMLPSLKFVPDMVLDINLRKVGMGPLHRGSLHLYAFSLVGAIGAALFVSSVYDLATLTPQIVSRARESVNYPQLTSLNHLLDLPEAEQNARLSQDPAATERIVALAEFLRANPNLHLNQN